MTIETVERDPKLTRHSFLIDVSPEELFTPNMTTRSFTKVVTIIPGEIVFDIGTGLAPLAIWAAKEPSEHIYAVEIVKEQYELAKRNIRKNNVEDKVTLYHGSFFDPIPSEIKADVILGDVSGIAENLARVMTTGGISWYPKKIPTGGVDGTEVIIPLLEQAGNRLKPKGSLYFPVGALSNYEKIKNIARSRFASLETKTERDFPLEPGQKELIERVGLPGTYTLSTKGSRDVWKGWIYQASDPIL